MMPLWLEVLLPFVGGLIGVAVGFFATWLRLRHERSAQWQRWFQESAAEFASRLGGASRAVDHAISRCKKERSECEEAVSSAAWLVGELHLPLNKVLLRYGKESPAGKAAREAIEKLDQSIDQLRRCLDFDKEDPDTSLQEDSADTNLLEAAGQAQRRAEGKGNTFLDEAYSKIHEA
jgi:hypothetical protein